MSNRPQKVPVGGPASADAARDQQAAATDTAAAGTTAAGPVVFMRSMSRKARARLRAQLTVGARYAKTVINTLSPVKQRQQQSNDAGSQPDQHQQQLPEPMASPAVTSEATVPYEKPSDSMSSTPVRPQSQQVDVSTPGSWPQRDAKQRRIAEPAVKPSAAKSLLYALTPARFRSQSMTPAAASAAATSPAADLVLPDSEQPDISEDPTESPDAVAAEHVSDTAADTMQSSGWRQVYRGTGWDGDTVVVDHPRNAHELYVDDEEMFSDRLSNTVFRVNGLWEGMGMDSLDDLGLDEEWLQVKDVDRMLQQIKACDFSKRRLLPETVRYMGYVDKKPVVPVLQIPGLCWPVARCYMVCH